jgi:hypothetical protein
MKVMTGNHRVYHEQHASLRNNKSPVHILSTRSLSPSNSHEVQHSMGYLTSGRPNSMDNLKGTQPMNIPAATKEHVCHDD